MDIHTRHTISDTDLIAPSSFTNDQNGWYKPMERNIKMLGEKAAAHAWIHDQSKIYLTRWSKRAMISVVVLSVISGTGTLSGFIQDKIPGWAFIIFAIFSYSVAIIQGIQEVFDFDNSIMEHKIAYTKFLALYHSIQKQLALQRCERQNAKDFYSHVLTEIDSLTFYSPEAIPSVELQYNKRFKNHHTFNFKNNQQMQPTQPTPPTQQIIRTLSSPSQDFGTQTEEV